MYLPHILYYFAYIRIYIYIYVCIYRILVFKYHLKPFGHNIQWILFYDVTAVVILDFFIIYKVLQCYRHCNNNIIWLH